LDFPLKQYCKLLLFHNSVIVIIVSHGKCRNVKKQNYFVLKEKLKTGEITVLKATEEKKISAQSKCSV